MTTLLLAAALLAAAPSGQWLGQDGHDSVGAAREPGANGVQDAHITLRDLPAGRRIAYARLRGYGSGEWTFNGSSWRIDLLQAPDGTSADLYFEPGQRETGRAFDLLLRFDDGTTANLTIKGGAWDPGLRMPDDKMQVAWIGQDGHDLTGPTCAVGPDGFQDVHLVLTHLFAATAIDAVTVRVAGQTEGGWCYGLNPGGLANAELLREAKATRADLYFSPLADLAGQRLEISLVYAGGLKDSATVEAAACDPKLAIPAPAAVDLLPNTITARWLGQDGDARGGRGAVHLALAGLPAEREVTVAALSDVVGGYWEWSVRWDTTAQPEARHHVLRWHRGPHATTADLFFRPIRDERGAPLTLRLTFDDGTGTVADFTGGSCDPNLGAPAPPPGEVTAHPGDNLADLVAHNGIVHLSPGNYPLDAPLVLEHAVHLLGEPGAELTFSQAADAPLWSTALKIHSGGTTLSGFAVRFATPIRWRQDVAYGPAVIGVTDSLDGGHIGAKMGLVFEQLDLQAPPPSGAKLSEAPRMMRLTTTNWDVSATELCGRIEGCTLKGGVIEFMEGPWRIVGNDCLGTVPGTFVYDTFAAHHSHDLLLARNHVHPTAPCGKTWRFLVMTNRGAADVVRDNWVENVGMRDNDTIPNPNAPELLLTEAYSLHFEGRPAGVFAGGRLLAIPDPQGGAAAPGDVVAVLAGPGAGQWVRIAQTLSPTLYLLEAPLPAGTEAVSLASGFVGERYEGNVIDARGSSHCADLVLVGDHFGTVVARNRFLGGGEACRLTSTPTEHPNLWGWSHAPFLGVKIEGNLFQDSAGGGRLAVEHNPKYIKSTRGRVYLSAELRGNLFRWTAEGPKTPPKQALLVGDPGSLDAGELRLTDEGNRLEANGGAPAVLVRRAP
jgi:hypothetical protein